MKHCPGCNRHLWVASPSSLDIIPSGYRQVAFNRKTGTSDGLQPWCRTCDWNGKATLDEAWNKFSAVLRKEPNNARLWTKESYLRLLGDDPHCQWCGSRCRDWGIGFWIDRQSNDYGHIPDNCVPCCSPCNFRKGHQSYAVYAATFLRPTLRSCPEFPQGMGQHPWAKIPHNDYPSSGRKFRRVFPPDLVEHEAPDPQLQLFGVSA